MTRELLDLSPLARAIAALADGLSVIKREDWMGTQPTAVVNTLHAGVIQSFEFSYELCIKTLLRRLRLDPEIRSSLESGNLRDTLRIGADRGFIQDVESWLEHRALRNRTSHTYDEAQAKAVIAVLPAFVADAEYLFDRLTADNV